MTMTTGEMMSALAAHGVYAPPFELRAEPVNGDPPPGYVGWLGVPLPDGRCVGVAWGFGAPSDDAMENWTRAWHAVTSPMTREELGELAARVRDEDSLGEAGYR